MDSNKNFIMLKGRKSGVSFITKSFEEAERLRLSTNPLTPRESFGPGIYEQMQKSTTMRYGGITQKQVEDTLNSVFYGEKEEGVTAKATELSEDLVAEILELENLHKIS